MFVSSFFFAEIHFHFLLLFSISFDRKFSRLNYYLFGLKPIWFHFTNILMHAIVCVLFTRVCIIVAGLQDNFAIIAGALFAIHPIHSEAVSIVYIFKQKSTLQILRHAHHWEVAMAFLFKHWHGAWAHSSFAGAGDACVFACLAMQNTPVSD